MFACLLDESLDAYVGIYILVVSCVNLFRMMNEKGEDLLMPYPGVY